MYSLKRNISWTLAGNVIYAITQWGLIILLAWLADPSAVGQFSLALAYVTPIILLSQFQLRALQVADAKSEYRFAHYLALRILLTAAAVGLVPLTVWLSNGDGNTIVLSLVLAIAKGFESISDIAYGALQKRERFNVISKSKVGKGLLGLLAFSLGMYCWREALPELRLIASTAFMALGWAIQLFGYDLRKVGIDERIKPDFHPGVLKKLAWWGAPLGVVLLLSSLSGHVPRILIGGELGTSSLGIYSALVYLLTAGTIVTNALGQAVAPRLSLFYQSGRIAEFRKLILRMNAAGAVVGGCGIVIAATWGREALTLLYTSDYSAYSYLLLLLLISGAIDFVGTFFGYALTAMQCIRVQMGLSLVWTACAIGSTAWLLPIYGLNGAAYSLIASAACRATLQGATLYRRLRQSSLLQHNDTE